MNPSGCGPIIYLIGRAPVRVVLLGWWAIAAELETGSARQESEQNSASAGSHRRFITAGFFLVSAFLLACWLTLEILGMRSDFDKAIKTDHKLLQLTTEALLLDEALSNIVSTGAKPGGEPRVESFDRLSARLNLVMNQANEIRPELIATFQRTSLAPSMIRRGLSLRALKEAKVGRGEAALALTKSGAFIKASEASTAGLAEMNRSVIQQAERHSRQIQRRVGLLMAALGGLVSTVLASFFIGYLSWRSRQTHEEQESVLSELKRQRQALQESEEAFRALFERSTDPILLIKNGKFVDCNLAAIQMLGLRGRSEICQTTPEILSPDIQPCGTPSSIKAGKMIRAAAAAGFHKFEWVHTKSDGTLLDVEVMLTAMKIHGEEVFHVIWRDITERKQAEAQLRGSEERFRSLIKSMQDLVFVLDESGGIQEIHQSQGAGLPGQPQSFIGSTIWEVGLPSEALADIESAISEMKEKGASTRVEYWLNQEGKRAWFDMSLSPYERVDGSGCWVTCVVRDITATKHAERELESQAEALASVNSELEVLAHSDSLTSLANRRMFLETLGRELQSSRLTGKPLNVLFIDLDNFKTINDTLGHETGDQMLVHVARSLESSIRQGSLAARVGGDEFAVLLAAPSQVCDAEKVAERIVKAVQSPLVVGGKAATVTCSIGVASSSHASTLEEIVRSADTAMYFAKHSGKSRWRTYEPKMAEEVTAKAALESDLREAMRTRAFDLAFQPIFTLDPLAPIELEVLIRWSNPRLGMVPPSEFIPLAEELGLINELGAWVLEESCLRHSAWRRLQHPSGAMRVAVNCSALQLQREGFPEEVAEVLSRTKMPPRLLTLEVTETQMMSDMDRHRDKLEALRLMGVKLAIDDFGAGYSSMGALAQLPLDSIKVDRSFIQTLGVAKESDAILRALVSLCAELRLEVVAEGIETLDHLDRAKALGCDRVQGYLFARPMSESDLHRWVESKSWEDPLGFMSAA